MQPAKRVGLDEFLWDEPVEDELTSRELRMIRAFIENKPVEDPEAWESAKRKGLEAYLLVERDAWEGVRHLKACLADEQQALQDFQHRHERERQALQRTLRDSQRRRVTRLEKYCLAVRERSRRAQAKPTKVRRENADNMEANVVFKAKSLLQAGRHRRAIAGIIAQGFPLTSRYIREILKKHGV